MSSEPSIPPPLYPLTQHVPNLPQILIIPATDSLRFQQGFLGADGERAAIEGELQVKETDEIHWRKVTMSLRTVEAAYEQDFELAQTTIVLYESKDDKEFLLPSTFSFALPLTPDTPQCIHTPQSSLRHILSATLHPLDDSAQPFSKTLTVHTRRFSSHTSTIPVSPVTRTLDNPSRVEVEIPRTAFTCLEPVPIYVTVPPPPRELVVEEGVRLRNIKAELIRIVRVMDGMETDENDTVDVDIPSDIGDESEEDDDGHHGGVPLGVTFPTHEKRAASSSSTAPYSSDAPQRYGASYRTVISRSGALCRFHAALAVRLRFILHQSSPSSSPSDSTHPLPAGDFGSTGSDAECASITQTTLLHSVSFRIRVHATFRNTSTHTERVSTITIPITFLPSPALLPEVEESMDSAYHKKHDRPPARTNRRDDADAAPNYDHEESEAGPSYLASGAPPPFEERDAPPPPFFPSSFPSSSRLPTFLESEQEIFIPTAEDNAAAPPPMMPLLEQVIEGEGILFGFPASSQFSGHTDVDRNEPSTPPPSVEMATLDPNVTALAHLHLSVDGPEHTIPSTLEQEEQIAAGEVPPPPPPLMDDPSDPPPSIHSEYRSREGVAHQATTMAQAVDLPSPQMAPGMPASTSHVSAPPPYLVPDASEHEQVARPPPYVDVMPPHKG